MTRPRAAITGRFFFEDEALSEAGKSVAAIEGYWITPGKQSPLSSFIDYDNRLFR